MKRLLFALVAVAAGIAALVLAVPLLSPLDVATVGKDVFVNPSQPLAASNSPTLARNPRLSENLVMTYRVDRLGFSAVLASSMNNGGSWRHMTLPLPTGLDRPFAPDVAFAPDGTLFVSYVNLEGDGNVPGNLWVATSKDGGVSLSDPVRVAGRLAFQARITVDLQNRAHVTWLQVAEVGLLRVAGGPNRIVSSTAADDGKTWSPPVALSDAGRERVGAATPAVDSEGHLVVLYVDYKSDRRDFEFLDGPPAEEPFTLVVSRSEDGGTTFSPGTEIDTGLVPAKRFLVFLPEFPSLVAGRDAVMYASWSDARNGDEDVFLRRSDDGGRSFGAAVRVNGNQTGEGTDQYLPRAAVAPDGRVDVLYLGRRSDPGKEPNVLADAYLASSHDEGATFATSRLSGASFDSRVGPFIDEKLPIEFGSRLGLTSGDDIVVAAWTDTRLGTEDTGRQDIAAVAVAFAPASPEGGRLALVVAALGLSLLSLLGWFVTGARGPRSQAEDGHKDQSLL